MDHDESALMAALAGLNTRIERFVRNSLDASVTHRDGEALGRDLVILGGAVGRHARVRTGTWGRSHLEPDRWHVRATENDAAAARFVDGVTVGPAICGAWLVADLPAPDTWDFDACSACLATLA